MDVHLFCLLMRSPYRLLSFWLQAWCLDVCPFLSEAVDGEQILGIPFWRSGDVSMWSVNATKGALGANIRKPTFVVHELGWIAKVFGHSVYGGCPTYCLTPIFGPSSLRSSSR